MRFLVDAQLPPAFARYLESAGHEASAVRDLGLHHATDREIWDFARDHGWILITKDEDFALRAIDDESGAPVVWLRIGNSTNRVLLAWFAPLLEVVIDELEAGTRLIELQRSFRTDKG
jgi:predicted nuclease of predicted toxin-antitoxin system